MSTLDTVAHAAQTPDVEQPLAELGLKPDEYANIREIVGRRPTIAELAMYSVMWSEHCSYKSSRIHLKRLPTEAPWVLVGPGENAGVIDVGDGIAAAIRIESHNPGRKGLSPALEFVMHRRPDVARRGAHPAEFGCLRDLTRDAQSTHLCEVREWRELQVYREP